MDQKIIEVRNQEKSFYEDLKSQNPKTIDLEKATIIEKKMTNQKRILAQIQSIFANSSYYTAYLREYASSPAFSLPSKNVQNIPKEQETRTFLAKSEPIKAVEQTSELPQEVVEIPEIEKTEVPKELKYMPIGKSKPSEFERNSEASVMITLGEPTPLRMQKRRLEIRKEEIENAVLPNMNAICNAIAELKKELNKKPQNQEIRNNLNLMLLVKESYLKQNERRLFQIREYRNICYDLNRIVEEEKKEKIINFNEEKNRRAL